MKNRLLTILALTFIMPLQAQLKLTVDGFVNEKDVKQECYIIECPGLDRCVIADAVGYFAESQLGNPWTLFNGLGCESFTVKGVAPEAIYNGKGMFRENYDMEYRIMFDFGDGFVRVWSPEILGLSCRKPKNVSISIGVGGNDVNACAEHLSEDLKNMYISENYRPQGARGYDYSGVSIYNKRGKLKQKYAKQSLEEYFNGFVLRLEQYLSNKSH